MCSNCSKTGHTLEKYWEPGGGSEGRALEWFKNAKAKKNSSGEKTNKYEKANAAMDNDSTNSGSESCALRHDLYVCLTEVQQHSCSIDWNDSLPQADIIAVTTLRLPYLF